MHNSGTQVDKDKSIIAAILLAFLLVITFAGGWPVIWKAFAVF